MNTARLASTWVGGSCCTPMACRRKLKTMMMRVKLVTVSMMEGATERTVKRKRISRRTETLLGSVAPPERVSCMLGRVRSCAAPTCSGTRTVSASAVSRSGNALLQEVLKILTRRFMV